MKIITLMILGFLVANLAHGDPAIVHGHIVDQKNNPINSAKVFTYRYIDQEAGSVGSGHPNGAGFFAPPGDELEGWYLFDVHAGNRERTVGPIYIDANSPYVILPMDGRLPYFSETGISDNPSVDGFVEGVKYCDYKSITNQLGVGPDLVKGYVVGVGNRPIAGATIYPYRLTESSVSLTHPVEGAGYFAPPGEEEADWYMFDIMVPPTGYVKNIRPIHIGSTGEKIILPLDDRAPFFGQLPPVIVDPVPGQLVEVPGKVCGPRPSGESIPSGCLKFARNGSEFCDEDADFNNYVGKGGEFTFHLVRNGGGSFFISDIREMPADESGSRRCQNFGRFTTPPFEATGIFTPANDGKTYKIPPISGSIYTLGSWGGTMNSAYLCKCP